MPDTGANYSLPPAYFVQTGDTILPSQHNGPMEDIAAALNRRMMRNGASPMTGNLQMGSKQITGLAPASQAHHAPRYDQVTPRSAWLLSVSDLSLSANEMVYARGTNTAAKTTLTAFARSLLDDASASVARTTLGLGSVATRSVVPISEGGTGGVTTTEARGNLGAVGVTTRVDGGSGLTGGGPLNQDRTIALGTPSSITASSTNRVTSTSHTHELSSSTVGLLSAGLGVGAIGTIALMRQTGTSTNYEPGDARAASGLRYANAAGEMSTVSASGTWQALSFIGTGSASAQTGLWQRIF